LVLFISGHSSQHSHISFFCFLSNFCCSLYNPYVVNLPCVFSQCLPLYCCPDSFINFYDLVLLPFPRTIPINYACPLCVSEITCIYSFASSNIFVLFFLAIHGILKISFRNEIYFPIYLLIYLLRIYASLPYIIIGSRNTYFLVSNNIPIARVFFLEKEVPERKC
jgi:hypothetical protein